MSNMKIRTDLNFADLYQLDAMRTAASTNKKARLYHGVLGLASEAGEVTGILQKTYQGHDFAADHMVKECGDCLWMIAEILDAIGVPMSVCMEQNIAKLKARYPDGFDSERSLHRAEGDI